MQKGKVIKMNWIRKKSAEGSLVKLPIAEVHPNSSQPRERFEDDALRSLADSIRRYGLLQPISVRRAEMGYELIAGERRLRAAALAGMREIPAIVYRVDDGSSAELALMENLLREDLDMFETARAMERLATEYGLTQEEIAGRLSVSQSYVANKLRLLRFSLAVRDRILRLGLTERHARALLRLPEPLLEHALSEIERKHLNVAATEKLVEQMLSEGGERKKRKKSKMRGVLRDIRLFYNSVDRAVAMVRRCGVRVESTREEAEGEIRLVICIPKEGMREG